jgi:hypothetical protein
MSEKKDIESIVANILYEEKATAERNDDYDNAEFESLIDMMECRRSEKDYEWMSDNFIPEFPSIILTDASDWANQYFQTRSFVEVKLEGDNVQDKAKCEAAKVLINKTLNNREIYHYHKYIRARHINALRGNVYLLCWWDKKKTNEIIGYQKVPKETGLDINGNPIVNPQIQEAAIDFEEQPVEQEKIIYDRFNYDVIDPRNVFTDSKYTYSVQDKDWVIVRSEKTLEELYSLEASHDYINLDKLKDFGDRKEQTETSQKSYNKDGDKQEFEKTPLTYFDIYERFGKFWCIVKEVDEKTKTPSVIEPGYDDQGQPLDNAELVETIITIAMKNGHKQLIRFQATPFIDSRYKPYKPLVRGWCYIHPTKDTGLSDGKYMRELQVAINDTFNMSNDRVKLATLPTMKGRKYSLMNNDTIYFEPEHVMELENPDDLQEFVINPDVGAAVGQIGMLRSYMQQIAAKFPTVMGELPEHASTTATAVQESGNRSNLRNNYKSLTYEYTNLVEFYWIILQMTYQFMEEETAKKVFGDKIKNFDPYADYTYSPVTASIEQEQSKYRKIQLIDQMIGRVQAIPNPNTPKLLNYLLGKSFELFGDEFPEYKQYLLNPNVPPPDTPGMPPKDMKDQPMSNQNGLPMGGGEINARNMMSEGQIG